MTSPSELTEAEYGSDPMAKTFRVLEIGWQKFNIFQDPGVERILEIHRGCVHPDYCHRGIFTALVQCIDLAHNDCQVARIETTSLFTEKACVRLGFETRAIVDYSTLEHGLLDLSKMSFKVMKIMTKPLSAKPAEVTQTSSTQKQSAVSTSRGGSVYHPSKQTRPSSSNHQTKRSAPYSFLTEPSLS